MLSTQRQLLGQGCVQSGLAEADGSELCVCELSWDSSAGAECGLGRLVRAAGQHGADFEPSPQQVVMELPWLAHICCSPTRGVGKLKTARLGGEGPPAAAHNF